ncbi:NUDIX domain-containing protein [Umezawaea sp.]|uniref:NUDIX hydrolase n=1 Tax=Umezawaea sp. TaxID=1955258 RepID=UPI002ED1CC93
MTAPVISVVGLVHVRDGRLLVVRSRTKGAFYLPGGKLEPGETPEQALHREVREELGVGLVDVAPHRRYLEPAYGEGPDTLVDMACYTGELDGRPVPSGEIAELRLVTAAEYAAHPETAPAIVRLLADLVSADLVS